MANFTRQITGTEAVKSVMESMGLVPPASVADSTDRNAIQFWALATEVGQQLLDAHDWQIMGREFIIDTEIGVTDYDLPDDFNSFVVDAAWNRTTRLPAIGSLEQYEWQMLKARNLGGATFTMLYTVDDDKVKFYDTPSNVQRIVLPYNSRAWVRAADGATYRDNLESNDDVILLDPQLFRMALKIAWYAAKQFNPGPMQAQFSAALEAAKAKDTPGRALTLSRRSGQPYLGVINIPDTNYGA